MTVLRFGSQPPSRTSVPRLGAENFSLILLVPALVGTGADLIDLVSRFDDGQLFRVFGRSQREHDHQWLGRAVC